MRLPNPLVPRWQDQPAQAIITFVNSTSPATMKALVYEITPLRWLACKVIGWRRPAVFWSRLSGLSLREVPVPRLPAPSWVRLRPILGGICGTDFIAITQRHHPANILQVFSELPALLGHENVSIIDEVGSEVKGWKPGDRVVVESSLSCRPRGIEPLCPSCAAGHFTLCSNFRTGPLPRGSMIGWNTFTGGSWSEYFVAHQSQLYRVPDSTSNEEAVLVDPIAGAMHGALKHRPSDGDKVLILGAGLLGMGIAKCLRALGSTCRLYALARHQHQAGLMQQAGVDEVILSGGKDSQTARYQAVAGRIGGQVLPSRFGHNAFAGGFDLVYDCVGSGQSLTDAMKYVRAGGTVVELGTSQITTVDTCPLWFDELKLLGANGRGFEDYEGRKLHTYEVVLELMQQGRLDLRGLLTHKFPVGRYQEAFATLANRGRTGAIKVAFEPGK